MKAFLIVIGIFFFSVAVASLLSDEPLPKSKPKPKPKRRRRNTLFDVNPSGPYKRLLDRMHGKDR